MEHLECGLDSSFEPDHNIHLFLCLGSAEKEKKYDLKLTWTTENIIQWALITMTAFVPQDVAIKMNLLL